MIFLHFLQKKFPEIWELYQKKVRIIDSAVIGANLGTAAGMPLIGAVNEVDWGLDVRELAFGQP